jgi:RNA polymerase sigma-70 factor (ECF subfamily)
MSRHSSTSGDLFLTTRWTVILQAGRSHTPQSDDALQELCRTYWYPLYAFVRRQGHSREDAEDLTQTFFAQLLEKSWLEQLSSDKGRFRGFLHAAMKHFLANEWDKAHAQKRGGAVPHLSLDWQGADSTYQLMPAAELSPDKVFDRAWSITLLERVLARLEEENTSEGKAEHFAQLKGLLALGQSAIAYPELAIQLGLSEGAARVAVHRLRKRYRELLREEVAQTLAEPAEVDGEMRALFLAFLE